MAIEFQPEVMPHLTVSDAAAAIDFYVRAFGAEELGRVPGPDGKKLYHARRCASTAPRSCCRTTIRR